MLPEFWESQAWRFAESIKREKGLNSNAVVFTDCVKLTADASIFCILFISSFSTQINQFDFLQSQNASHMSTDFLDVMTFYIVWIEHWNKQTSKQTNTTKQNSLRGWRDGSAVERTFYAVMRPGVQISEPVKEARDPVKVDMPALRNPTPSSSTGMPSPMQKCTHT